MLFSSQSEQSINKYIIKQNNECHTYQDKLDFIFPSSPNPLAVVIGLKIFT